MIISHRVFSGTFSRTDVHFQPSQGLFELKAADLLIPVYVKIFDIGTDPRLVNALPPDFWILGGKIIEFHNQQYGIVFSNHPIEERIESCLFVSVESVVISFGLVKGGEIIIHAIGTLFGLSELNGESREILPYPPSDPGSRGPYRSPFGFPEDPSQPPAPGFEFRPPDREPGVPEGSWYNPGTDEYLRWDPDENYRHGTPHYDYRDLLGILYWIWPDGSITPKRIGDE